MKDKAVSGLYFILAGGCGLWNLAPRAGIGSWPRQRKGRALTAGPQETPSLSVPVALLLSDVLCSKVAVNTRRSSTVMSAVHS